MILNSWQTTQWTGATTFGIMTLGITTFGIMALGITTVGQKILTNCSVRVPWFGISMGLFLLNI